MERLLNNKSLGDKGESFFNKYFPESKWINENEESCKDYDFIIPDIYKKIFKLNSDKIDVKVSRTGKTITFQCKIENISNFLNKDKAYVFLVYNEEEDDFDIIDIIESKKILDKYHVFNSFKGEKTTSFIYLSKKDEEKLIKTLNGNIR
tara:strand:- start:767 stop:1213 length:447 start_codon:yes stop_codon:yes gene_type:complete